MRMLNKIFINIILYSYLIYSQTGFVNYSEGLGTNVIVNGGASGTTDWNFTYSMISMVNGGGIGTNDWTPSTNGLTTGWVKINANSTPSIITGNGFTGNAQQMTNATNSDAGIGNNSNLTMYKTYYLSFKYIATTPFMIAAATINTINGSNSFGPAASATFAELWITDQGTVWWDMISRTSPSDYIAIDEVRYSEVPAPDNWTKCEGTEDIYPVYASSKNFDGTWAIHVNFHSGGTAQGIKQNVLETNTTYQYSFKRRNDATLTMNLYGTTKTFSANTGNAVTSTGTITTGSTVATGCKFTIASGYFELDAVTFQKVQ